MPDYKLVVAYDGTDFHGWQRQPDRQSIVSVLESAFEHAFRAAAYVRGASRTDAGVHARGQVAVLKTSVDLPGCKIKKIWNAVLPLSIQLESAERKDGFNPLDGVLWKRYSYTIFKRRPGPFEARWGWFWKHVGEVDWHRFRAGVAEFVGEHDFRSFCKLDPAEKTPTIRRILSVSVQEGNNKVVVNVVGKGFVHYQVRRMIGAALYFSRRNFDTAFEISSRLENPDPQQHYVKAGASGLCLEEIHYAEK